MDQGMIITAGDLCLGSLCDTWMTFSQVFRLLSPLGRPEVSSSGENGPVLACLDWKESLQYTKSWRAIMGYSYDPEEFFLKSKLLIFSSTNYLGHNGLEKTGMNDKPPLVVNSWFDYIKVFIVIHEQIFHEQLLNTGIFEELNWWWQVSAIQHSWIGFYWQLVFRVYVTKMLGS